MPLLRKRRTDAPRVGVLAVGGSRVASTSRATSSTRSPTDPTRSALTFVDAEGIVDRRSFAEIVR